MNKTVLRVNSLVPILWTFSSATRTTVQETKKKKNVKCAQKVIWAQLDRLRPCPKYYGIQCDQLYLSAAMSKFGWWCEQSNPVQLQMNAKRQLRL